MSQDRTRACDILGVSKDASETDIRAAYKRLALKWHPDKHASDPEATQKFQEISAAYKYLTTKGNNVEFDFTMEDMFDLFARMFFGSRVRQNGFYDSSDDYSDDDDDDSEDNFWESVHSSRTCFGRKSTEYSYTANRPSASEASKNAEELMKEEERHKKNREKRKSKKKRQREKKREEKVRKEEEEAQKLAEKKRQEEFLQRAKESAEKAKCKAEQAKRREAEQARQREAEQVKHRKAEAKQTISMSTSSYKGATNSSTIFQNSLSNGFTSSNSKPKGVNDTKIKTNTAEMKMETENWASSSESDEDITGWDQNSAFFAGAAATINKRMAATAAPTSKSEKTKKKGGAKGQSEKTESIDNMDPIVLQSRQMAVKGNEMANLGQYSAAIDLFTQAIELDPRDFRFFGNRSFCYDRLQQYENALKDADRAITLSKDWPKGYFRKGRALAGLKQFAEAESAFVHVLKLDKNCEDAVEQLSRVRIARLMEMGFTRPQSDAAIRQYGSVQAALDALLSNGVEGVVNSFPKDLYISDEEDYITETIESSKLDSRNPLSVTSLWVGNLHSTVSEKQLHDLFGPYGEIVSLRRLPDRFCAFINYARPEEAARALEKLQGVELGGRFLLIKFPDNPITDGQPRTTILKKTNANKQQVGKAQAEASKVTGPVNGNECYFWRTTGCVYGDRCRYKHLKNAKGADLKPWQKVMYDN